MDVKFHPNTAFMKTYTNFNFFFIRVFWFKYISPIIFEIGILYQMLLPKNRVSFKGLHYSRRWCIDKLGIFHVNQTSMSLHLH